MTVHTHVSENGIIVKCYHICKNNLTSAKFWFGLTVVNTLEFLPEHFIWFKLWPFYLLSQHFHLS